MHDPNPPESGPETSQTARNRVAPAPQGLAAMFGLAEAEGNGPTEISGPTFMVLASFAVAAASVLSFGIARFLKLEDVLTYGLFYIQWGQLALAFYCLRNSLRHECLTLRAAIRAAAEPTLVGLAATAIVFLSVKPEFRVLADETNLVGSSMSLYMNRTYRNVTEGYFYYDTFHPIASVLDKRPALYPFLLMLMHDVLGFSPFHGFALNFVATIVGFALLYALVRRVGGRASGIVAVMLLAGIPVYALAATSSGFEALNMALLVAAFYLLWQFLEEPTTPRLEAAAVVSLLAASCRYESVLVLLPIGAAALLHFNKLRFGSGSLRLLALPLLVVPLNWQKQITTALNEGDAADTKIFSLDHLEGNLRNWLEFLFDPNQAGLPSAPPISVLAVLGLGYVVYRLVRAKGLEPRRLAGILTLGTLAGIIAVQLAYYLGDPRQVAAHRVTTSYAWALAALAAIPLSMLVARPGTRLVGWMLAIALATTGLARAGVNEQGRWLLLYREYKELIGFVREQPHTGTLIVSDRPGMYASHQYGAVNVDRFNRNADDLMAGLRRHLYDRIYFTQKVFYNRPDAPEPHVSERAVLETVREFQNDSQYYYRISKLVDLKPKLETPAASPSAPAPSTTPALKVQ